MEARYLIIARYAEFAPDGKLNILGGDSDQIISETYPYVHTLLIAAAKISFTQKDVERETSVLGVIIDRESGEVIGEGGASTIPILSFPEGAERASVGIILQFGNTIFNRSGKYILRLLINDQVAAEATFRVAPLDYYKKQRTDLELASQRTTSNGSDDHNSDQ